MTELDFETIISAPNPRQDYLYVCKRCLYHFASAHQLEDIECVHCNGDIVFFHRDPYSELD